MSYQNKHEYKPEWVEKIENWSKRYEHHEKRGPSNKTSEYIATIIANILLIMFWGRIPEWLPFIKDSFAAILPLSYISFAAAIIVNFLFIIYDGAFFKGICKVLLNIIAIAIMVSFYYIYPFDFSAYPNVNWDVIVRIILIVGIFGTVIGTISEFFNGMFSGGDK